MENTEIREKSGKYVFDEKVREIHESGENEIVLENVDVVHFISIFCQIIRVISVIFAILLFKLESGKYILSQGKLKLNNSCHPDDVDVLLFHDDKYAPSTDDLCED